MDENTVSVPVVYQGGVFVPEQDVSFLEEGTRLEVQVPAPPDEWDQLLEELVARATAIQSAGIPEALDWMGDRWVSLLAEDAGRVIDFEGLLRWSDSPGRRGALLL